jgi:hypothetical protein
MVPTPKVRDQPMISQPAAKARGWIATHNQQSTTNQAKNNLEQENRAYQKRPERFLTWLNPGARSLR